MVAHFSGICWRNFEEEIFLFKSGRIHLRSISFDFISLFWYTIINFFGKQCMYVQWSPQHCKPFKMLINKLNDLQQYLQYLILVLPKVIFYLLICLFSAVNVNVNEKNFILPMTFKQEKILYTFKTKKFTPRMFNREKSAVTIW